MTTRDIGCISIYSGVYYDYEKKQLPTRKSLVLVEIFTLPL